MSYHRVVTHEGQHLFRSKVGVGDERARNSATLEGAIWVVAAVGKGFGHQTQPSAGRGLGEGSRGGKAQQWQLATEARHTPRDCSSQRGIDRGLVIQGAVRLDVLQVDPVPATER